MSFLTAIDLRAALQTAVRSAGHGGRTTAQDVRTILGLMLDELEAQHGAAPPALEFVFGSGYADACTATCGSAQAGYYAAQRTSNEAAASYVRNGTAVPLPFTLAAGDTLAVAITRTDAGQPAVLSLLAA
jgi:hypothetical protein